MLLIKRTGISPPLVRLPHTFRAFRNPYYRILWPANFLSLVSRWMQMTLLGWLVLDLTNSPIHVALVGFFGMLPMLILGLPGGVLADAIDRQRLLKTTQMMSLLAAMAMLLLLLRGLEQFWHAYLTISVVGVGWALEMPTRRSLIHDLLGKAGVTNAIALDSMGMSGAIMLGPALAGVLISLLGVAGGFTVVSLFYCISLALLTRLRLSLPRLTTTSATALGRDLLSGLSYAVGNSTLLATILITVLMNLLMFPYMYMIPVMARDVLHVGPTLMGLLQSTAGFGAFVGAVVVASLPTIRYHGRLFIGGSIIAMFCLLVFAFSRWYVVSLPALFALGIGSAGFSTMQATLVMLVSKEGMRGKTLGVVSLAIGTGPLGALSVGAVANATSPNFALTLNATVGVAALILIAVLMPSIRRRIVTE